MDAELSNMIAALQVCKTTLAALMKDPDPQIRFRACEAILRLVSDPQYNAMRMCLLPDPARALSDD